MNRLPLLPLLLCTIFLFFTACISNKKHTEALNAVNSKHEAELQRTSSEYGAKLHSAEQSIDRMRLELAERKGMISAMTAMQDKWQQRIKDLENEIENVGANSRSNQNDLSQTIRQKEKEIGRLKTKLKGISGILDRHITMMETLSSDLRYAFQVYPDDAYDIASGNELVRVQLPSNSLFKAKSTTRMLDEGYELLRKLSEVLLRHPNMSVVVIGHIDNSKVDKRYKDSWNYSALQAATIVRVLTEDLDLNPSQVLLGAKGEFAPRASNETTEGKLQNRRIEFEIAPRVEELTKAIRRGLEE